jgi:hypothetical protein
MAQHDARSSPLRAWPPGSDRFVALEFDAWLLGQALMNAGLVPMQQVMGMVGARGLEAEITS